MVFKKGVTGMEGTAAQRAAEMLLAEHKANATFKPFDRSHGPATISDAYDIQDRYVALLRSEHGNIIGYKVGLTSETMQKFCGIDHPIGGVVLANRLHRSGATIRRADFGRLGLEFEIAVRIKSDVPPAATPLTVEKMAPYIGGVCAAIELVDDRAADYAKLDMLTLISDNSWNGGIVVSELVADWPDLQSVPGKATRDGAAIGEGHGRDILGHPFNSVAWLAAHLASRGESLKAGQIVMTGSVMKTVFPTEDAVYAFALEKIGNVSVTVR
jgi:2-keto-4-pentenoate hydratase